MNKKKIIFFINSLKFFISHRINIAEIAFENNFEVIIVAKKDLHSLPDSIKSFKFIDLNIRNHNLFNEIKNITQIRKIIQKYNPYICHFITVKSIFYAALLSKFLKKTNSVLSFSGIGSISSNKKIFSVISKLIFYKALKKLSQIDNLRIIFQNNDDKKLIKDYYNFNDEISYTIPGSGINLTEYSFRKLKDKNYINFLFASRLLIDKGLMEFIKASQKILDQGYKVTFTVIGEFDNSNPSIVNSNKIINWADNKNKFFNNFQINVKKFIQNSDVVVLPSYREGYPKILIEASAIGRAILTTNVPGCRECVIENLNGLLVSSKDYFSLFEGMRKIIIHKENLEKMGYHSRKIAEKKYDINYVNKIHLMIYNSF